MLFKVLRLSQELERKLSVTPEPLITSVPFRTSEKIRMKKKRAKAKKRAQEKGELSGQLKDIKRRAEARERNTERSKFVIKTGLEAMLCPILNQDKKDTFANLVHRVICHVSDFIFETLIGNHVGLSFNKRTLRYLFAKIFSAHEPTYFSYSTGIKRDLCKRICLRRAENFH
ncbi:hypothetical protein CU098_006665, partial [Rhizopus stolonifer]